MHVDELPFLTGPSVGSEAVTGFDGWCEETASLRAKSERLRIESIRLRIDLDVTIASLLDTLQRNREVQQGLWLYTPHQPGMMWRVPSKGVGAGGVEPHAGLGQPLDIIDVPWTAAEEPEPVAGTDAQGKAPAAEGLTAREIEVLRHVALGKSTKELAYLMGISFKTAACHRYRVMCKLGIHDAVQLARYAIRCGLVEA